MPRLSHLFEHVRDLEASVRFWTETVGLELLLTHPGYARVGGAPGFHLGMEERDPSLVGAPGIELAIEVDDVAATYERMRDAGVTFTGPPQQQEWGAIHAWFVDPDGYRCSIFTRET
jgi:catechol 2,3-dioxygenase-like lactoylglutathione lyase family enzyme